LTISTVGYLTPLSYQSVSNITSTPFLILVYKVLDICISAKRRKEAMRWHRLEILTKH